MRWLRLFAFGVVVVYPIFWTAQFVLFLAPEALYAAVSRHPLSFMNISYVEASAFVLAPHLLSTVAASLSAALICAALIVFFRGHRYRAGGLAMVILGQSALVPFLEVVLVRANPGFFTVLGAAVAFALICIGLSLLMAPEKTSSERMASFSLLVILPQTLLWMLYQWEDPYLGSRLFVMLVAPLFIAALIVSSFPRWSRLRGNPTPTTTEILVGVTLTTLLVLAIGLASHTIAARRAGMEHAQIVAPMTIQ